MAVNTITEVLGENAAVSTRGNTIKLRLPRSVGQNSRAAQAVIKGLRLHLSIISEQFESTISIEDSEV
jgi:uncharacterized protein YsxB (DUF464 family)